MEGTLPSLVLYALSLAAAISAGALGAILSYHWFAFGSNRVVSITAVAIFSAGSLMLIIALVALASAV